MKYSRSKLNIIENKLDKAAVCVNFTNTIVALEQSAPLSVCKSIHLGNIK